MNNDTLYIVDARKKSQFNQLEDWLVALSEVFTPDNPAGSAHVLLLGFDEVSLVACHRHLFRLGVAPRRCHTLLPDQEETLASVSAALPDIVVQHMINALMPSAIIDIATGERRLTLELTSTPSSIDADRPTLAFISPLPPQTTGIANYSAELLPYLATHFTITLVVDQPEVDRELSSVFECINADTFLQRAESFDYTLYQVGNSLYHAYQFGLLQRHPGIVVLHDYFLFDAVWWLNESGLKPDALVQQLYIDHGYPALLAHAEAAQNARGAEQYPVNGMVTRPAGGLIYHSAFARSLAERWQQGQAGPTYLIPHLRQLPAPFDKQAARKVLGIASNERVIASFGGINPKKLSHLLLDAFLGDLEESEPPLVNATSQPVRLVLVGAQHSGEYGHTLARRIKRHPFGCQVTVTGYASRQEYQRWLQAADIAVQLRTQSRGETSGAIIDAMAHGLAVIANAHGSSAELPSQSHWQLADDPEQQLLAPLRQALCQLIADDDERERLGQAGRAYVTTMLAPERVAEQYRLAILEAPLIAPRYQYERFLDQLAAHEPLSDKLQEAESAKRLTKVLSEVDTTPDENAPRLLFDVSTIAWEDLKTGIERVTRRVADYLLRYPPAGWRIELIRWGGDDFYLARGFASQHLGLAPPGPDVPVEARPGDRYVSLEWAPPLLKQAGHIMRRMRASGVRFYFTVHDLLPLSLPACFPEHIPATMKEWFTSVSELADGITCVSRQVAEEVDAALDRQGFQEGQRPWVKHFHLGADFQPPTSAVLSTAEQQWLQPLARCRGPILLMVGTIEPRKGHQQVLDAMEQCWAECTDINLVVVGKQGWQVEGLVRRIKRHPRRGQQLFWVEGASDTLLEELYRRSDVLVAASYGEGFGLPLIEAARQGIAIFARDIPVFREVAGDYATYFDADTPQALAQALQDWASDWREGHTIASDGMPYLGWQQSSEQWLAAVLGDQLLTEQCSSENTATYPRSHAHGIAR
ncbi:MULTISPECIES: glycosyltransferase [Halomonadaceae]|uniref:glycosyltransferase n=1 Tax=Halomonadaceae TaxID=28256 RepID=UPI001E5472B0|nr:MULTISPECIES: glycosyltransferase [Halomonas]MCD1586418.1 glycosyltransferase [Halomonas sp. IOP_14]MCE7516517.1 glycosyltransferase [Halomonas titanicae]